MSRMFTVSVALATLLVSPQSAAPFEEKIPGTLASFKMQPIPAPPGGKPFYISTTEVTWDVFDIWAFRLDQSVEDQAKGVDAVSRPSKPYGAPDKGFGHKGYAALGMTYLGAQTFCGWLSKKTGKKYRLPTEAEWEYAARAGSTSEPELDQVAWFWDNAEDKAWGAGTKKPNAWGLYDTLGNMAEWAVDKDGKPVTCGGHYLSKKGQIGFTARAYQIPKWNENDPQNPKSRWWLSNAPYVGIRLVCDLP